MRLLVFQHIDCEHPGSLRRFLREDDIDWQAVELDQGEPIPNLDDFDALWVMGGPMDVWDTDEHPWLVAEKAAIRHWVTELKRPYLGLCLGHQLLADALGGSCAAQLPPEIGILDVELNAAGQSDVLFKGLAIKQKCLQWHSVCVDQLPDNTTILASSETCRVQAMRVGANAWSMQYHVEVEEDTVDNWGAVPAYRDALIATLGDDGLSTIKRDAEKNMQDFLKCSQLIYQNFRQVVNP